MGSDRINGKTYYERNRERLLKKQAEYDERTKISRRRRRLEIAKNCYEKHREAILLSQKRGIKIAEARAILAKRAELRCQFERGEERVLL